MDLIVSFDVKCYFFNKLNSLSFCVVFCGVKSHTHTHTLCRMKTWNKAAISGVHPACFIAEGLVGEASCGDDWSVRASERAVNAGPRACPRDITGYGVTDMAMPLLRTL